MVWESGGEFVISNREVGLGNGMNFINEMRFWRKRTPLCGQEPLFAHQLVFLKCKWMMRCSIR